jgi:hypothetical protein
MKRSIGHIKLIRDWSIWCKLTLLRVSYRQESGACDIQYIYTYLVDLDPGHDSLLLKDVDDLLRMDSGLVKGLLEEDSTRDVLV